MSDIKRIIEQNKADLLRMHEERNLRFDKRCRNIPESEILTNWIAHEIETIFEQKREQVVFEESRFAQTLPDSARHLVIIGYATNMMPESGPRFTSNKELNSWCDAYRAMGFANLADLLESTRDIRPTHEKWNSGIKPTDAEESRIQAVCDEICSHNKEIDAARFEYTLKHRAELEAISPTIKEIFERYDRKAFGLDD